MRCLALFCFRTGYCLGMRCIEILFCLSEMFGSQNEVYRTIVLPQSEVFGSQNMILPQNEVFRTVLLQNEAFAIVLPQNEVNISVLLQGGIFRVVIVSWQLFSEVKAIIDFVGVNSIKNLTSTLVNGVGLDNQNFVGVSSGCSKDVCL